jgi:hypothetical protein
MIGGGFVNDKVIWTCQFSKDNYVLIGDSDGYIKIYGPTFTNSLVRTYNPTGSGNALSADFFYCENSTRIIMVLIMGYFTGIMVLLQQLLLL